MSDSTKLREAIDRIKPGDWVHVRYPEGHEAMGTVRTGVNDVGLLIAGIGMTAQLRLDHHVFPSEVVEHRPAKRVPAVGDVIDSSDFDRIYWPTPGRVTLTPEHAGPDNRGVWLVHGGRPYYADLDDCQISPVALASGQRFRVVAVQS